MLRFGSVSPVKDADDSRYIQCAPVHRVSTTAAISALIQMGDKVMVFNRWCFLSLHTVGAHVRCVWPRRRVSSSRGRRESAQESMKLSLETNESK